MMLVNLSAQVQCFGSWIDNLSESRRVHVARHIPVPVCIYISIMTIRFHGNFSKPRQAFIVNGLLNESINIWIPSCLSANLVSLNGSMHRTLPLPWVRRWTERNRRSHVEMWHPWWLELSYLCHVRNQSKHMFCCRALALTSITYLGHKWTQNI